MLGTPDELIERTRRDEYGLRTDNGLPHEERRKSLEPFVKEVMPALR
ncbi:hypothetical protein KIK06_27360 [Nocardiopsis sp. EMB25]|nr:hypothetical protein [Nocardiopsis sp. EMB25]MCY9787603.1 hypothetical protein [Nocardiopsis sp. EMB25]